MLPQPLPAIPAAVLAALLPCVAARADGPASGVYHAEEVKGSPRMKASGIAWWKDRLIIADRGGVGTPQFVAVHPNGAVYWSGFPDGEITP